MRQNLNHASTDKIDKAVFYAKQYMLKKMPEWLLGKYIDTLEQLVDIANKWYITLQPEIIYLDSRNRPDPKRMVDAVEEVFNYGDKHGRKMTVNAFMNFVLEELPQPVFERRHGRPMQDSEKRLAA